MFTGLLGAVIIALTLAKSVDAASAAPAAYIGLFALTYLWVGAIQFTGVGGAALGWFSLVVAGVAVPLGVHSLSIARGTFDHWIAISWIAWAGLWFLFFLTLGLGRSRPRHRAGRSGRSDRHRTSSRGPLVHRSDSGMIFEVMTN